MITIRPAETGDDAALVSLDDAVWTPLNTPAPLPEGPRSYFDRTDVEDVIVAVDGDSLLGYSQLRSGHKMPSHAHVIELNGLAVAADAAGQGIGKLLVEAAVAEAARRGARKVTLRVLGGNDVARRLYARCGFVEEGVLREEFFLGGAYVDDVFMARFVDRP
jgi:ribosomal protein S18 acetylase RimI-like enzyme